MKKPFLKRMSDRALQNLYHAFGRDMVSSVRIIRRDDMAEIGSEYGGWLVPLSVFDANSVCYCAGCGEDITFDLGMIERFGCNIYGFDPTPRAVAHVKNVASGIPEYKFFEYGLWDKEETLRFYVPRNPEHVSHSLVNIQQTEDYISVPVRRLKDVMQELGHSSITLLKIDIEGAEYRVLESIVEDRLEIEVLCVEYDEFQNPLDGDYKKRISQSMRSLLDFGYQLIGSQGNGNYTFLKGRNV